MGLFVADTVYKEIVEDAAAPAGEAEHVEEGRRTKADRNPADDQRLSKCQFKDLESGGEDVHDLKGNKDSDKRDLFKDKDGNIHVKPKRQRPRRADRFEYQGLQDQMTAPYLISIRLYLEPKLLTDRMKKENESFSYK